MIEIILGGLLLLSAVTVIAGMAISRRIKALDQVVSGVKRSL